VLKLTLADADLRIINPFQKIPCIAGGNAFLETASVDLRKGQVAEQPFSGFERV